MEGWTDGWMNGWMADEMDEWMDGWMNASMGAWMDETRTMQMRVAVTVISKALMKPKMIVESLKATLKDSRGAKNSNDETENGCKIHENGDDKVLGRITRAASQKGPRRTSVFPKGKSEVSCGRGSLFAFRR